MEDLGKPRLKSLETHDYKLIYDCDLDRTEMFCRRVDPDGCGSQFPVGDLFLAGLSKAGDMERKLARAVKASRQLAAKVRSAQKNRVALDKRTREQLKSLGYIQ